jgi:hypothetical protein
VSLISKTLRLPLLSVVTAVVACGPSPESETPKRPPLTEKWLSRARDSYRQGDMSDATDASESALKVSPHDPDVRVMKARVALARLDLREAAKLTEGIQTVEAHQIRSRALWYAGDIDAASEEIEAVLADPSIKDSWATEVGKLARGGQGRHPFAIEGGLVGAVEMPRAGASLVVPCELEGEHILALVDTAVSELMIDSSSRREPAWVNLRFAGNIEVKDVPALTRDLAPVSRQYGATIKALIGVNMLRHIHATFDRRGDQFVVRREDPPAPPEASRVPLFYARGGGMMLRAGVTKEDSGQTPFFVDTTAAYAVALEDATWKRAGVDPSVLKGDPQLPPNVKSGILPILRIVGFDLPEVPALENVPLTDLKSSLDIDLGGVVGAGVLALFRVTFGDDGRFIWVEPDPTLGELPSATRRPRSPPPPPVEDGTAPSAAPAPPPMQPDATPPPAAPKKPDATPSPKK